MVVAIQGTKEWMLGLAKRWRTWSLWDETVFKEDSIGISAVVVVVVIVVVVVVTADTDTPTLV